MPELKVDIFARNLRGITQRQNVSIASICQETGINRQQFSRYLNGKYLPSTTNMLKICSYFKIQSGSLMQSDFNDNDLHSRATLRGPVHLQRINNFAKENTCPEFLNGVYFCFRLGFAHDLISKSLIVVRTIDGYRVQDEITVLKYKDQKNIRIQTNGSRILRHGGILSGYDGIFYLSSTDKITNGAQNFSMYRRSIVNQNGFVGHSLNFGYNDREPKSRISILQRVCKYSSVLTLLRTCGYYDKDSKHIDEKILISISAHD